MVIKGMLGPLAAKEQSGFSDVNRFQLVKLHFIGRDGCRERLFTQHCRDMFICYVRERVSYNNFSFNLHRGTSLVQLCWGKVLWKVHWRMVSEAQEYPMHSWNRYQLVGVCLLHPPPSSPPQGCQHSDPLRARAGSNRVRLPNRHWTVTQLCGRAESSWDWGHKEKPIGPVSHFSDWAPETYSRS